MTRSDLEQLYDAVNGTSVGDDKNEDALSKSLRELGEGMESDEQ